MEAGPDKKGESVEFVMYAYMQINKREGRGEGRRRERGGERRRREGERERETLTFKYALCSNLGIQVCVNFVSNSVTKIVTYKKISWMQQNIYIKKKENERGEREGERRERERGRKNKVVYLVWLVVAFYCGCVGYIEDDTVKNQLIE